MEEPGEFVEAATPGNWEEFDALLFEVADEDTRLCEAAVGVELFLAEERGSLESPGVCLREIDIMILPDTGKLEFDFFNSSEMVWWLEES